VWKTYSSGVDWVTTTAPLHSDECDKTEDLALTTLSEQLRDGHRMRPQKRLQFDGLATPHVFVGRSTTHQMVQVSGGIAHRFALRLREEVKNARVTRLDFEATLRDKIPDEKRAREAFKAAEAKDFRTPSGRQVVADIKCRPRCGDTLYIGARTSDRFGRFYNKSAESGGTLEDGLWRCECEQKGKIAPLSWSAFCESESPSQLAFNVVKATFQDWGFAFDLPDEGEVVRLPTVYEATDEERTERWFREMISSTAQKIEERRGAGYVEKLLGLKSAK
jgi:hypothetical protein